LEVDRADHGRLDRLAARLGGGCGRRARRRWRCGSEGRDGRRRIDGGRRDGSLFDDPDFEVATLDLDLGQAGLDEDVGELANEFGVG